MVKLACSLYELKDFEIDVQNRVVNGEIINH